MPHLETSNRDYHRGERFTRNSRQLSYCWPERQLNCKARQPLTRTVVLGVHFGQACGPNRVHSSCNKQLSFTFTPSSVRALTSCLSFKHLLYSLCITNYAHSFSLYRGSSRHHHLSIQTNARLLVQPISPLPVLICSATQDSFRVAQQHQKRYYIRVEHCLASVPDKQRHRIRNCPLSSGVISSSSW